MRAPSYWSYESCGTPGSLFTSLAYWRVQSTPPAAPASPPCDGCPLLAENLELRQQAGYWKEHASTGFLTPHQNSRPEIEQLRAQLRPPRTPTLWPQGRNRPPPTHPTRLPVSLPPSPHAPVANNAVRSSPPRRDYRHLPVVLEDLELPADQQQCPNCGQPFAYRFPAPRTVNCWRSKSVLTACVVIVGTAIAPPAVAAAGQVLSAHPLPPNSSPKVNWECPSGSPCCWTSLPSAGPRSGSSPTSPVTAWTCRPVRSPMVSSGWCACSNLSTRLW